MVLEGPCTRDTPCGGRERGATGAFGRGVAATPLLHTQNCGMSRDRGVATPWSATEGGVASAPLSAVIVVWEVPFGTGGEENPGVSWKRAEYGLETQ